MQARRTITRFDADATYMPPLMPLANMRENTSRDILRRLFYRYSADTARVALTLRVFYHHRPHARADVCWRADDMPLLLFRHAAVDTLLLP